MGDSYAWRFSSRRYDKLGSPLSLMTRKNTPGYSRSDALSYRYWNVTLPDAFLDVETSFGDEQSIRVRKRY